MPGAGGEAGSLTGSLLFRQEVMGHEQDAEELERRGSFRCVLVEPPGPASEMEAGG